MKTHRLGIVSLVFCVFLTLGNTRLMAQDVADWSSWTSVVVNHKFNSSLRLMSKMQVRSKDNFSASESLTICKYTTSSKDQATGWSCPLPYACAAQERYLQMLTKPKAKSH